MEQSIFERVRQQIDDTAQRATRAAFAVSDILEDGVAAARRAARDGTETATDFLHNTKRRFQRHPLETAAIVLAVGIAAGTAVGWMIKPGRVAQRCEQS